MKKTKQKQSEDRCRVETLSKILIDRLPNKISNVGVPETCSPVSRSRPYHLRSLLFHHFSEQKYSVAARSRLGKANGRKLVKGELRGHHESQKPELPNTETMPNQFLHS